jgi:serine/threonine-protein kinase
MFDELLPLPPLPGDVLAGRYRVLRHVAAGGFGDLYLAEQLALGRRVALKVLHPELSGDDTAVERFRLEAQAACRLSHPNLVVFHDFGADEEGRLFLVMEYIDGRTLADVLDETPLLPLDRVLRVVVQVCDALHAAHEAGIVHRDVKPANVMLTGPRGGPGGVPGGGRDGETAKVIDFGILKRTGGAGSPALTRPDEVLGTPEYVAPEIVRGDPFDGRADQYGAGVLLWELLVGRRPFGGANALEVLEAQVRSRPPTLRTGGRQVPPPLRSVVARALAKRPEDRYPSMAAMAAALRTVAATLEGAPGTDPTRLPGDPAPADARSGDESTVVDFPDVPAAPAPGDAAPPAGAAPLPPSAAAAAPRRRSRREQRRAERPRSKEAARAEREAERQRQQRRRRRVLAGTVTAMAAAGAVAALLLSG